ncbi:hypothetical protein BG005_008967 [Podila minutissima]|nr:hypothetical protein BG005_008967 [Podila minutissima]
MASNSVAAAAWSGSQTLYVQYRNPYARFGTLLAIDTSPAKSPSPSPPTPSTSPFGNPAIPSSGGSDSKNSLFYEVQPVSSVLAIPVGVPMSLSMVSVSSLATRESQDLLLAYNQVNFLPPVLLRYTPSSASGGQAWTASSATLAPAPPGTEAICLAPGRTTSSGDSPSFFYQLAISTQLQQLRKVDAHGSVLGAVVNLEASRIYPQLVALTDPGAHFDTVIIGECPMLSGSICLVFSKDNIQPSIVQMTGGGSLITGACYTAANGFVVRIMADSIYTYSYSALAQSVSERGTWIAFQPPSGRPRIQTPLLACTSSGSTLYAIAEGSAKAPISLYRINTLAPSLEWDTIQLSQRNNGDDWMPPPTADNSSNNGGLSKGALIGIIVAVLGVLGILAFVFWRQRSKKGMASRSEKIHQNSRHLGTAPAVYSPVQTDHMQGSLSNPIYVPMQAPLPERPVIYGQPSHPGMLRENSEYSSQHNQSRPWSREGVSTPFASASYSPNIHQEQIPMIATSLGAAPTYNPYVVAVPPSPSPMQSRSPTVIGDKQELSSEEQNFDVRSPSSASFHGQQQQPVLVSGSLAVPSPETQPNPEGTRNGKKPRIQSMMSPALANAQLILQASQNRPQPPPPQAGPSSQPPSYYAE